MTINLDDIKPGVIRYFWAQSLVGNNKGEIDIIKVKNEPILGGVVYYAYGNIGYWRLKDYYELLDEVKKRDIT